MAIVQIHNFYMIIFPEVLFFKIPEVWSKQFLIDFTPFLLSIIKLLLFLKDQRQRKLIKEQAHQWQDQNYKMVSMSYCVDGVSESTAAASAYLITTF